MAKILSKTGEKLNCCMKLNHQIISQLTILFITVYCIIVRHNASNAMHAIQCMECNVSDTIAWWVTIKFFLELQCQLSELFWNQIDSIQYNTALYYIVQCSIVQYNIVQCSTIYTTVR